MSLFQIQVERQFLAGVTTDLNPIYKKYLDYFGNPAIKTNILEVIEEQYQGEFIRALFVDILGYTAQPHPNFNLIREKKNETDAKSADAAISINNQIVAVIELKDHKTQDLKKVEVQAFGYKNNHKNCHYVVTSNFERLRFYIDNAVDFIEFDLFNLTFEEFRRLWLCLSYESIAKNLPQEIKSQSISNEDIITKQLYKDYSVFKRLLFDSIVSLNPDYDKLLLFKKTQKLLDRFLFLLFAEDKELLPANSVKGTVEKWKKFNADPMNDYQSLYSRFVKYFKLLDEGYKDANIEIYAYNGGLFANDDLLNQIRIDDAILSENVLKLAAYDYGTDVDVNILGHIFENSLNEIEQVANEITTGEKTTSKRKQDGVFYTPRYITQYIVENTVGRLCEEKKTELGIGEELFEYKRVDKKKQALKIFDIYREWLLHITIVDPACGSGAFLNMALDFLMAEHNWIDQQQEKIAGLKGHYSMELSNIENTILENNLFGVDINDESVEIAKLSLWLRTAKPHRKLNSLNNNIKCGNSLIDEPAVAGEKAFNWKTEFPQVFAKGGFDVVIGNPPYVGINTMPEVHNYLKNNYSEIHTGYNDLMYYFIHKGISILNISGIYGVITSNYFIGNDYAEKTRVFLNYHIEVLVNFEKTLIFESANVHTALLFAKKITKNPIVKFYTYNLNSNLSTIDINIGYSSCELERQKLGNKWLIADNDNQLIIDRLFNNSILLGKICDIAKGSESGKNEVFTINAETASKFKIEKEVLRKCIKNSDVLRYHVNEQDQYIIYADNFFSEHQYPNAYKYLEMHKDALLDRRGPKSNEYEWWRLHRPSIKEYFDAKEKLIVPYRANKNRFAFDNQQLFNNGGDIRIILLKEDSELSIKYILALLNSTLLDWFYGFIGKEKGDSREYFNKPLSEIPIKNISFLEQQNYVSNVDNLIFLNKRFQESTQKFQRMLQRKFELEELPGKLQNWYLLSYKEFIAELGKKKVKLTLAQEFEWEEFFTTEKAKALEIKKQIDDTDREIDRMVYELYGLTEEEIKIVEGK